MFRAELVQHVWYGLGLAKTQILDIFETPVTVTPQQEISKT